MVAQLDELTLAGKFELQNPTGGLLRTFLQSVKRVKLQFFQRPMWSSTLQNVLDPANLRKSGIRHDLQDPNC